MVSVGGVIMGSRRCSTSSAVVVMAASCLLLSAAVASGCLVAGKSSKVKIGDETAVCLTFNNVSMAYFTPEADQFSRMQINGSFDTLPLGSGLVQEGVGYVDDFQPGANATNPVTYFQTFTVSSMGIESFPRLYKKITYYGPDAPMDVYTFTVQTAIVHVTDGRVDFVSWDDGCFFCDSDSSRCQQWGMSPSTFTLFSEREYQGCGEPLQSCPAGSGDCDLQLYVVWTGNDEDGNFFQSAGLRFSRYQSFGLNSLYSSARDAADGGVNNAKSAGGKVV